MQRSEPLVRRRAPWCRRGRPGVEDSVPVWRKTPWCGGERPGVEEGGRVWRRVPGCGGGRPGVDEDATGKEGLAHQVRRRAPLRKENSESISDTSRKRTSGAEGTPYAKTQGGAAALGRPSLYPPLGPARHCDSVTVRADEERDRTEPNRKSKRYLVKTGRSCNTVTRPSSLWRQNRSAVVRAVCLGGAGGAGRGCAAGSGSSAADWSAAVPAGCRSRPVEVVAGRRGQCGLRGRAARDGSVCVIHQRHV